MDVPKGNDVKAPKDNYLKVPEANQSLKLPASFLGHTGSSPKKNNNTKTNQSPAFPSTPPASGLPEAVKQLLESLGASQRDIVKTDERVLRINQEAFETYAQDMRIHVRDMTADYNKDIAQLHQHIDKQDDLLRHQCEKKTDVSKNNSRKYGKHDLPY